MAEAAAQHDFDAAVQTPIEELLGIQGRGAEDDLFHCLVDRYHYLECKGTVGEHMKYYAVDYHNRPLACLLFGSASWKTASRDQFIGWNQTVRKQNLRFITNNTHFLILPLVRVPHLASFILGACLRRLREDRIQKYGHEIYNAEIPLYYSRCQNDPPPYHGPWQTFHCTPWPVIVIRKRFQ